MHLICTNSHPDLHRPAAERLPTEWAAYHKRRHTSAKPPPHPPAHAAARAFMESAGDIAGLTLDDLGLMSSEEEREMLAAHDAMEAVFHASSLAGTNIDDGASLTGPKIGACTVQGSYSLRVSKLRLKEKQTAPSPGGR